MAVTSTTTLNNQLKNYYVPRALITLYNKAKLYEFADKAPQPKGSGNSTAWNAWVRLAGASSTLAQGGNNTAASLSSRRVSATIAQYGRGYQITDLAEFMSVLDVRNGAIETLTESGKETVEFVCHLGIYKNSYYANQATTTYLSSYVSARRSAWSAVTGTNNNSNRQFQFPAVHAMTGTAVRISNVSGSAPSISAQLSLWSIRKAVRELEVQNAMEFPDGNFVLYTHPNGVHSIRKDKTWEEWNRYMNSRDTLYAGEVGRIYRTRVVSSTLCPRYAVAARSIITSFIFGRQAFGVTEALGGLEMFIVDGPDSNNPYNTYSMLTYKLTMAAAALNPSAGRILAHHESLNT